MKKRRNDGGYSLVEMIIVLAIVAVVASMALISITLIHSAKVKEAAVTVDEEIATLITKSKNMKCDRDGWQYALRIYADSEEKYYIQKGYFNPTTYEYDFTNTDTAGEGKGRSLSSYSLIKFTGEKYHFVPYKSGKWIEDHLTEEQEAAGISDVVFSLENQIVGDLNSNATGGASLPNDECGGLFIRFNKDGTCAAGAGDIIFCKKNESEVAHVYLRVNGSHQAK